MSERQYDRIPIQTVTKTYLESQLQGLKRGKLASVATASKKGISPVGRGEIKPSVIKQVRLLATAKTKTETSIKSRILPLLGKV